MLRMIFELNSSQKLIYEERNSQVDSPPSGCQPSSDIMLKIVFEPNSPQKIAHEVKDIQVHIKSLK